MRIQKVILLTTILWTLSLSFAWGEEEWQKDLYLISYSAAGADGDLMADNRSANLDSGLKGFGGTLGFSTMKNKWGFYIEGDALSVRKKTPSSTEVLKRTVRRSSIEAGVVYSVTPVFNLLTGVRHQGIGLKVRAADSTKSEDSTGFLDFFAGVKIGRFARTDRWFYWAGGDIGKGESDFVWNLRLEAGYRFTEKYYMGASFRYLNTDFKDSDIQYDGAVKTMGLVMGYSF